MKELGDLGRTLIRRRRDFFDAAEECRDEWGSEYRECMCRHGQESSCDDYLSDVVDSYRSYGVITAVTVTVVGLLVLICACAVCACRRRRTRGSVFRTASGP